MLLSVITLFDVVLTAPFVIDSVKLPPAPGCEYAEPIFELAASAGVTTKLATSVMLSTSSPPRPVIVLSVCVALPCVDKKVAGLNFLKYK